MDMILKCNEQKFENFRIQQKLRAVKRIVNKCRRFFYTAHTFGIVSDDAVIQNIFKGLNGLEIFGRYDKNIIFVFRRKPNAFVNLKAVKNKDVVALCLKNFIVNF